MNSSICSYVFTCMSVMLLITDYELTEEQLLRNVWVSVNQPNSRDEVNDYVKGCLVAFDAMDTNHDGKVINSNCKCISKDIVRF